MTASFSPQREGKKYWGAHGPGMAGRLAYLRSELGLLGGLAWLARTPRRRAAERRYRAAGGDAASRFNDRFFDELHVPRRDAEHLRERTHAGIATVTADQDAEAPSASVHGLAFAALRLSGLRPAAILEIGTYLGETTSYLAALFPEAVVHTVDLPDDDPLFAAFHHTGETQRALFERRLSRDNVVVHRINSVRLAEQDLPRFDLVWLDGGHRLPEVAWDHAYALGRLTPGGWLLSDDVVGPENFYTRFQPELLHPKMVLDYLRVRVPGRWGELAKREDAKSFLHDPKTIVWYRKP